MVFGPGYATSVPVAMILLIMNMLRGTRQVLDRTLRATLKTRFGMMSEGVGLVSFAVLAPVGSSLCGLIGIAGNYGWGATLGPCGHVSGGLAHV